MNVENQIRCVHNLLTEQYGTPPAKHETDPLDSLVLTILSQNTTDKTSIPAFRRMKDRFPTYVDVRDALPEELIKTIRTAGLSGQKSERIQEILRSLTERFGKPTLDYLADLDDADALAELTSFKGVGVKTASCVLCFALKRPVFPVDTHILRISIRLGWIPENAVPDKAHAILNDIVPREIRHPLHLNMILHGRTICRARKPQCAGCPLLSVCPFGKIL